MRRAPLIFVTLALVAGSTAAQSPLTKLSGEVVTLNGANLQLKTIDKSAIGQGVYLGTTAAPQPDGTLVASEVHIFAEAMRGTSEGHRPMPNDPVNTMTNATVASVSANRTQDAAGTGTVVAASSQGAHALRMTLHYKGGEKVVIVPDDTPIVMMEMGERGMLVPGAHVVVYATQQPGGALLAERINIGKNGYVPLQ